MNCALLVMTLLSADDAPDAAVAAPPEAEIVAAPSEPEEWPGEGRRVHWGIGARVHAGYLESIKVPRLIFTSEFTFFTSVRVFGHHEWRIGVGVAAGWPDTAAGETNVSFRFHLTPRISIGAGLFTYIGFYSIRAGLEVPLSIRLGSNRRHEINVTLRGMAGGYNNTITFAWYRLDDLSFAIGGDVVVGYSLIF